MDFAHQSTQNSQGLFDDNMAYVEDSYALITVAGPDAKPFINRLVTADVLNLKPQQSCMAAFLTNKGRIIDVVHILLGEEDTLLMLCHRQKLQELNNLLQRFLFVEDVAISFVESVSCVRIFAPLSCQRRLASSQDNKIWMPAYAGMTTMFDSFLFNDADSKEFMSRLIVLPEANCASFLKDFYVLNTDEYQTLRIHSLVPQFGNEISDKFNPLEVNLECCISWNKGCYIGQEVISRLKTYQKQKRFLVGLVMNETDFEKIACGEGIITSKAPFFVHNKPCALAVIKGVEKSQIFSYPHIDTDT